MANTGLALTAIEPLPQGDWLEQTQFVLKSVGLHTVRRSSELLVWSEILRHGNVHYTDACSIRRIWLSPGRAALGVTSKRLYFLDNSTDLDSRPERVVFSETRRPESSEATELSKSQWALIGELRKGFQYPMKPVELTELDADLKKSRQVHIAGNTYHSPPKHLNQLYREHGFDEVPEGFTISLCPLESVSQRATNEFAARLKKAANQRHLNLVVKRTNSFTVSQRVEDMAVSEDHVREGHCVLFVLPNKDQKPNGETKMLFIAMEENGIPFRRAYANDPLDFSIPDQLPSLLIAAGGVPHRSPTETSGTPLWTIGVDLSHRVSRTATVLALTLVNPDGELVGAWKRGQPLDETARTETIAALLSHCQRRLASCERNARIAVLRDGRMFANEDSNLYRDILETNVSLFEYRKGGNPQIVQQDPPYSLPRGLIAASLPGASTMFVTTAPPRNERTLASIAKVTWCREWNDLGLEPEEIGKFLTASALS